MQPDQFPLREGESGPVPVRSARTFRKEDGWYFMTREKVDVGPFATQELAEKGVQDYAGFSMDAERIYFDSLDIDAVSVADDSEEQVKSGPGGRALLDEMVCEVFDRRRGDDAPAPVRTSRLFSNHEGWWFATREGGNIGPFPERVAAEKALVDFVVFATDVERVVAGFEQQDIPGLPALDDAPD